MEKAVKDAIRAGGIRTLPYDQQVLVARALIILSRWPDEMEQEQKDSDKEVL